MSYATIDELRSQLGARQPARLDSIFTARMNHRVPDAPVVKRAEFILDHCRGKRVLDVGASGPLHDAIVAVAAGVVGIDRHDGPGIIGFDLDDVTQPTLPTADADVIICGEVLEHLSNPGWFLTRLRRQYHGVTTIVTVPNAFGAASARHLTTGIEHVNIDHCCWYSFRTITTLLKRVGYTDFQFAWYNGAPLTAEGLLVVLQ